MDERRFDDLARSLAAGIGRRRLLGALAAVVPAALLGGRSRRVVAARKKVGQTCDRDGDCCDGARCNSNGTCVCKAAYDECDGACFKLDKDERHCGACDAACAAGQTCCGGACRDLQTDAANCGGCGTACAETEICSSGTCIACPPGRVVCGNVCCLPG